MYVFNLKDNVFFEMRDNFVNLKLNNMVLIGDFVSEEIVKV